jgi:excisionase family DNA binding protein
MFFDNCIGGNEWLTTDEAARLLSISPNALRIMVHRGQVEVYKFGRRLRFRVTDCLALIKKKGAANGH